MLRRFATSKLAPGLLGSHLTLRYNRLFSSTDNNEGTGGATSEPRAPLPTGGDESARAAADMEANALVDQLIDVKKQMAQGNVSDATIEEFCERASLAKSPKGAQEWCTTLSLFASDDDVRKHLCKPNVLAALLGLTDAAVMSQGATEAWCSAYRLLVDESIESQRLMGTPTALRSLLRVGGVAYQSTEACDMWCTTVGFMASHNADTKKRLTAEPTVTILEGMVAKAQLSSESAKSWCGAVAALAGSILGLDGSEESAKLFGTEKIAKGLQEMATIIKSQPGAVGNWLGALGNLALGTEANKKVFGTEGIADALVNVADACAANSNISSNWCMAVGAIVEESPENRKKFGTKSMFDSLNTIAPKAGDLMPHLANWFAAISSLCYDNRNNQKLAGERIAFVDILTRTVKRAKLDGGTIVNWCNTVSVLAQVPENQKLFGTPEFVVTLQELEDLVLLNEEIMNAWCRCLAAVANGNETNQQLFGNADVVAFLIKLVPRCKSDESVRFWLIALNSIFGDNPNLHQLTSLFDHIMDSLVEMVEHAKKSEPGARLWVRTLATLSVSQPKGKKLVVNEKIVTAMSELVQPCRQSMHATVQFLGTLATLTMGNPDNHQAFLVPATENALFELVDLAALIPPGATNWLAVVIALPSCINDTAQFSKALIQFLPVCQKDDRVARNWCTALAAVATLNPESQQALATEEIFAGLKSLSHSATRELPVALQWLGALAAMTVDNLESQNMFCDADMAGYIADMIMFAKADFRVAINWCKAIIALCGGSNAKNQDLLGADDILGGILELSEEAAKNPSVAALWCLSVAMLVSKNAENQALFGEEGAVNALLEVAGAVAKSGSLDVFCWTITALVEDNVDNQRKFADEKFIHILFDWARKTKQSINTAQGFCPVMTTLTKNNMDNKEMFGTPQVIDILVGLAPAAARSDNAKQAWQHCVRSLAERPENVSAFASLLKNDKAAGILGNVKQMLAGKK